MLTHAAAFVRWDIYRPSKGAGGVAVYDYGSDRQLLHTRVADGGTLWLITSTGKRDTLKYHLAYKLVNCTPIPREDSVVAGNWKYVVRAQDWRQSRHFGYNDASDIVRRLQFASGKPMREVTNVGTRLLAFPELTAEDVELLERLQHKIENSRAVFISYSREDRVLAEEIESELSKRDVTVSRDAVLLKPGQDFAAALKREVEGTDCFVVLISPNSAESTWVRREVDWALKERQSNGLVKTIIPAVLPEGGWDAFRDLHSFERWDYPVSEAKEEGFNRLAEGIVCSSKSSRHAA